MQTRGWDIHEHNKKGMMSADKCNPCESHWTVDGQIPAPRSHWFNGKPLFVVFLLDSSWQGFLGAKWILSVHSMIRPRFLLLCPPKGGINSPHVGNGSGRLALRFVCTPSGWSTQNLRLFASFPAQMRCKGGVNMWEADLLSFGIQLETTGRRSDLRNMLKAGSLRTTLALLKNNKNIWCQVSGRRGLKMSMPCCLSWRFSRCKMTMK